VTDGKPFTAKDIAFTFNLMKKFPALDNFSVCNSSPRSSHRRQDRRIQPQATYTPALFDIAQQPIVPEHIWKDIEDPVKFTNENPSLLARSPSSDLPEPGIRTARNPNYWQPGKPYIQACASRPTHQRSSQPGARQRRD